MKYEQSLISSEKKDFAVFGGSKLLKFAYSETKCNHLSPLVNLLSLMLLSLLHKKARIKALLILCTMKIA